MWRMGDGSVVLVPGKLLISQSLTPGISMGTLPQPSPPNTHTPRQKSALLLGEYSFTPASLLASSVLVSLPVCLPSNLPHFKSSLNSVFLLVRLLLQDLAMQAGCYTLVKWMSPSGMLKTMSPGCLTNTDQLFPGISWVAWCHATPPASLWAPVFPFYILLPHSTFKF